MRYNLDLSSVLDWLDRSFHVDADAGQLVWKLPPKVHPRMMGKPAGSARLNHNNKRYVRVKMNGTPILRSWLIFTWVNRRFPAECIDHIDGNSLNDSIRNLREASVLQNAWNHKGRAKKSNLPMGVRTLPNSKNFQARIAYMGKMIHLGTYPTAAKAQQVYQDKRKELYREFA